MANEIYVVDGSERWEGSAVRVAVIVLGELRELRLRPSAIAFAVSSDASRTVSRSLPVLEPAIMAACRQGSGKILDLY